MVFASTTFLFLVFPIFFIIFFFLKRNIKIQNIWILIASLVIYAWGGISFALILGGSIIFNYIFTLEMDSSSNRHKKKALFIFVLAANILLLVFFKYLYFIASSIKDLLLLAHINKIGRAHV